MYTTDILKFRFVWCAYNVKLDIRLSASCASHDHYLSQRVSVYIRKNTYTVLVPFQFRNLASSYCFGTILKTVFREMIWADYWRAWRRPFGSLCIHKLYPNSSFNRYRRVITAERHMVQQDTFTGISGVWTIVNETSSRHNFKEKLRILYLCVVF